MKTNIYKQYLGIWASFFPNYFLLVGGAVMGILRRPKNLGGSLQGFASTALNVGSPGALFQEVWLDQTTLVWKKSTGFHFLWKQKIEILFPSNLSLGLRFGVKAFLKYIN